MARTLVCYLYREDERTRENLRHFLSFGVGPWSEADFLLIINDFACTVPLPDLPNFRTLPKENSFDLCAFRVALEREDLAAYDYFIFLNSSCVGPFHPAYITEPWFKLVTSRLCGPVHLVGPIVEIPPDNLGVKCLKVHKALQPTDTNVPFIHTYFFAVDRAGLKILLEYDALPPHSEASKSDIILVYERLVTSAILNEGGSIESFLLRFRNVDLTERRNWNFRLWSTDQQTCPEIPGNYEGIDVAPLEVMFVKNIRSPHAHRLKRHSGISATLSSYLSRYLAWSTDARADFTGETPRRRRIGFRAKDFLRANTRY